jgi:hypothetical protein
MEHSFTGTPKPRADYHILAVGGHDDRSETSSTTRVAPEGLSAPQTRDDRSSLELQDDNKHDQNNHAFRRVKPSVLSILADITAVGVPLAFIVLSFIILRLDGHEPRDRDQLAAWENTVTVVCFMRWRQCATGF